jgi:hypothetical protein
MKTEAPRNPHDDSPRGAEPRMREHHDTVIVGGQAGLAMRALPDGSNNPQGVPGQCEADGCRFRAGLGRAASSCHVPAGCRVERVRVAVQAAGGWSPGQLLSGAVDPHYGRICDGRGRMSLEDAR